MKKCEHPEYDCPAHAGSECGHIDGNCIGRKMEPGEKPVWKDETNPSEVKQITFASMILSQIDVPGPFKVALPRGCVGVMYVWADPQAAATFYGQAVPMSVIQPSQQ